MNKTAFKNYSDYIIPYIIKNKSFFYKHNFILSDFYCICGETYIDLKFSTNISDKEYNILLYQLNKEDNIYTVTHHPTYILARFKVPFYIAVTAKLLYKSGDRYIDKYMLMKHYEYFKYI